MKQMEFSAKEYTKLPDGSNLLVRNMEEVLRDSMMPYAEYVILDRALPRVEDGLKPVQRRILYTMNNLGLTPDKPYRKSAAVVGDCLAKYHPHGDTSVYDAMVRLAQPFNMRECLVDGQGNFGSVDGDSAAAMRYTEARMAPLALELLRDLDMDTVKWSRNYDDKLMEPDMLPGRFPNLLVNGAMGIAVGLATNIPPHNLGEVIDGVIAYIDDKRITLKDMMKIIKGPDFPTGGYVIANELVQAYETGRGKITMVARIHKEDAGGEKKNIVITELPYQVNKADLLTKILAAKEAKKDGPLSYVQDIVDESDKEGMRAVIKVKKDGNVDKILAELYKQTNLQCTFGINMVAIAGGKPRQMGLMDIISYYTDYQRQVVLNRTKFQLKKAKERAHILEGLIIAVANIDEVVAIIKKSSSTAEARNGLKERFKLSDAQADAILELKLARLTRLEVKKLEEELAALKKDIARYTEIINNKHVLDDLLKQELTAIKRQYRDDRRTTIVQSEDQIVVRDIKEEKVSENYVIGLTAANTVKRIPAKNFSMSDKDISERSTLNNMHTALVAATGRDKVMFFTDKGNCYQTTADKLKDTKFREDGFPLSMFFSEAKDEKPVAVFTYSGKLPEGKLLFYTEQGMVKLTDWSEYGLLKTCFGAIKLKEDDSLIGMEVLRKEEDTKILMVTKDGMCIAFLPDEVPEQGRVSGGVKGIMLEEGDSVVYAGQITLEGEIVVVTDRGYMKRVLACDIDRMTRYRKGVKILNFGEDTGSRVMFVGTVKEPYDVVLIDPSCMLTVNTEEMPIESRMSKGKPHRTKRKGMPLTQVVGVKTTL